MAEEEGFALFDRTTLLDATGIETKQGYRGVLPLALPFESFPRNIKMTLPFGNVIFIWRRKRDSNPRGRLLPPNDLANRPLQPLGYSSVSGGRGGIRTLGTVAGTPVFKTGTFNHSATLP